MATPLTDRAVPDLRPRDHILQARAQVLSPRERLAAMQRLIDWLLANQAKVPHDFHQLALESQLE
jgi:hypothetical protein